MISWAWVPIAFALGMLIGGVLRGLADRREPESEPRFVRVSTPRPGETGGVWVNRDAKWPEPITEWSPLPSAPPPADLVSRSGLAAELDRMGENELARFVRDRA